MAGALRSEFVLTGTATLLGAAVLRGAFDPSWGWLHESPAGLLAAVGDMKVLVPLAGAFVGAAFVVGLFVVQLTFFVPTEALISVRRQDRLFELRSMDERFRSAGWQPGNGPDAALLQATFGHPAGPDRRRGSLTLRMARHYVRKALRRPGPMNRADSATLSLGRQLLDGETAAEYAYRRSNRQLFVGTLPATALATAGGAVHKWEGTYLPGTAVSALFVVLGLVVARIALASADYQEKVAQGVLLDAAFRQRWSETHVDGAGDRPGPIPKDAARALNDAVSAVLPVGPPPLRAGRRRTARRPRRGLLHG